MGLLDNAIQALKDQYQETKGNVGLLMSNPKQYMSGLNQDAAEYNRLSSLALQAERNAYRGIPVSPEQLAAKQYIDQQQQDMTLGFVGNIKPVKPVTGLMEAAPDLSYRGSHTPPNAKVYGATIDNLGGIMPVDVYSSKGTRLYGLGNPEVDSQWFAAAYKAKGKPDADVTVYRAVPKGVKSINNGDWVTTSKTYAQDHGESALNGEYEILSKKVKAKTLSSEGYPYEFGYHE